MFSFLLWLGGGFVSCRLFVGSVFDCHALDAWLRLLCGLMCMCCLLGYGVYVSGVLDLLAALGWCLIMLYWLLAFMVWWLGLVNALCLVWGFAFIVGWLFVAIVVGLHAVCGFWLVFWFGWICYLCDCCLLVCGCAL